MKPDIAEAIVAKEALAGSRGGLGPVHEAFALADPAAHPHGNTVGYEVGLDPDGNPCVNVLVRDKLPAGDVHPEALAPRAIDGIPVRVVATGPVRAEKPPRPRVRLKQAPARFFPELKVKAEAATGVWVAKEVPARGGASVGHFAITAGTIGALCAVRDGDALKLAVLSNNHVLGNSNLARLGDAILQPGPVDGGAGRSDRVAQLIRFVPLHWGGAANAVDGAVAWTRWERLAPEHHSFTIDPTPTAESLGLAVMKDGRTTGHTTGRVVGVAVDVAVSYAPEGGLASFHGQFRVASDGGAFSMPGDSGSLIVTAAGRAPVGLLFSGGDDPDGTKSTFCCPIAAVMESLGIERFLAAIE